MNRRTYLAALVMGVLVASPLAVFSSGIDEDARVQNLHQQPEVVSKSIEVFYGEVEVIPTSHAYQTDLDETGQTYSGVLTLTEAHRISGGYRAVYSGFLHP